MSHKLSLIYILLFLQISWWRWYICYFSFRYQDNNIFSTFPSDFKMTMIYLVQKGLHHAADLQPAVWRSQMTWTGCWSLSLPPNLPLHLLQQVLLPKQALLSQNPKMLLQQTKNLPFKPTHNLLSKSHLVKVKVKDLQLVQQQLNLQPLQQQSPSHNLIGWGLLMMMMMKSSFLGWRNLMRNQSLRLR